MCYIRIGILRSERIKGIFYLMNSFVIIGRF